MTLAAELADYALSVRYSDLDKGTVEQLKIRVVDAIGCALGAYRELPVGMARRAVLQKGPGEATILGTGSRTTAELATFVNGLMIRYFDFNDTYLSKEPAHPSDNLSTCLAVSEAEELSGKELIAALAVAYEIQCRLCDAANIRHRGWDHVNYGLVSTALAASKLKGLDHRKATEAVNISLSGHIAMRQVRAGELSMWKGASFANAARNGVFAARLASEGMTGPSPIFEGEMGFFRQVSGPFELDVGEFGGRGGRFRVNDTYIKFWPAEYHAQTAVWAAIEAREKAGGTRDVESVLVETHEAGFNILGKGKEKWMPATKETADHSLPFIVGTTLLSGELNNQSYSSRNLRDERVLDFLKMIEVRENSGYTAQYPNRGMPNRVTLRLKGGRKVSAEALVPRGHPRNPMTKKEVETKFYNLVCGTLGKRSAKEALERLWNIDDERDIRGVLACLRAHGSD